MSSNTTQAEEDFEFAPIPDSGKVNVANPAYGAENTSDHTYTVTVQDGEPTDCTCLGYKYGASRKHLEAVENNKEVLFSADPDPLAPVGRADECPDCGGDGQIGEWACFTCVRIGEGQ